MVLAGAQSVGGDLEAEAAVVVLQKLAAAPTLIQGGGANVATQARALLLETRQCMKGPTHTRPGCFMSHTPPTLLTTKPQLWHAKLGKHYMPRFDIFKSGVNYSNMKIHQRSFQWEAENPGYLVSLGLE